MPAILPRLLYTTAVVLLLLPRVMDGACSGGAGSRVSLVSVNGIMTTFDDADANLRALEGELGIAITRGELVIESDCILTFLQYNPTNGFFSDVFEAASQLGQTDTSIWRLLYGLLGQFSNINVLDIAERFLARELEAQVVSDLANLSHTTRQAGGLVLIGHSQGNLYVNRVYYNNLSSSEKTRTAAIAIATPADNVPGGKYTTLKNDFIWQWVPRALGWNTDNGPCGSSVSCHDLIESYLQQAPQGTTQPSEPQIRRHLVEAIQFAVAPPPTPVQWLTFVEGNPGRPGDGVFINGRGPNNNYFVFDLSTPFALGSATGGFTVSAFAPGITSVSFTAVALRPVPCNASIGFGPDLQNLTPVTVNGVQGIIGLLHQDELPTYVAAINHWSPGCNITLNDLYITQLWLNGSTPGQNISVMDAASLGLGQGNLPLP